MLIRIEDPDDPRLAPFRRNERGLTTRADRRRDGAGLFLAEGDLVVERAFAAGCQPVAVLADPDHTPPVVAALGIEALGAGTEVRRLVTSLGLPQPVIALFRRPPTISVADLAATAERLVVVEAVDNPANIGAIVRNAAAFGWHGLVLDATSADPLARRSLRVAMGTAFALPHARVEDLPAALALLAAAGHQLVALTPTAGATELDELDPPARCSILVGSERGGLTPATLGAATVRARIPMATGIDSLNVAAATAVACYALRPRS